VMPQVETLCTKRTVARQTTTDWKAYEDSLGDVKRMMKGKSLQNPLAGHVRMIIGYNEKTGEVAISDSWGRGSEERWMTMEEASAVSQREMTVIRW